jgi:DNA-binding HxlR family transcriptional regulator
LARALDVVGDRWSLLVVRELLVAPARYGDLLNGLEGVATNMLAQRLRELEDSGIVQRRLEQGSVCYALTPWGEGLREPIEALVRWSEPLMARGRGSDSFNARWLLVGLRSLLGRWTSQRRVCAGLEVEDRTFEVCRDSDGTKITLDPVSRPSTTLTADPETVLGLAAGAVAPADAIVAGRLDGSARVLTATFATQSEVRPNDESAK